jgi:hypothetical protein
VVIIVGDNTGRKTTPRRNAMKSLCRMASSASKIQVDLDSLILACMSCRSSKRVQVSAEVDVLWTSEPPVHRIHSTSLHVSWCKYLPERCASRRVPSH